jgi:hypothetical protein
MDDMRGLLDGAHREIDVLKDRCRRFEQRWQLAQQDRELLEQRLDLYRKHLERCEQEFDASRNGPAPQPVLPGNRPALWRPAPPGWFLD